MSRRPDPCALCGWDREPDVRPGLVRWAEPRGRLSVTAAPRCSDRAACRLRVESAGGTWDVDDARPREEDPR